MPKHKLQDGLFCNYHTGRVVKWDVLPRPVRAKENTGLVTQCAQKSVSKLPQPAGERLTNAIIRVLPNPQLTNAVKKWLAKRNANVTSLRHIKSIQIRLQTNHVDVHLWLLNNNTVVVYGKGAIAPSRNEVWKSFKVERLQSGSIESHESIETIIRNLLALSRSTIQFVWE